MDHKLLFFICLMADILKLLNTLSLFLQKQAALLVDIKYIIWIGKIAETDWSCYPQPFSRSPISN